MMGTTGYLIGLCGGLHFGFILTVGFLVLSGVISLQNMPALLFSSLQWSTYVALLSTFHFLEFFSTALWQPNTLSFDSFVVNHSRNYTLAVLASFLEFWLEQWLLPSTWPFKRSLVVPSVGLVMVLGGQMIRTCAMWTCGQHFSHQIMVQRVDEHRLVTHGIYRLLRHPSYFGWFYWSVGTQLVLCNPLCTVLYAITSWQFFNVRIPFEERTLRQFYRSEYDDYCRRTIVGIPFIANGGESDAAERNR
jgi:protein-S-isoprenylcysteine O-methyltransferase